MTTRRHLILRNDGTVLERMPDGCEVPVPGMVAVIHDAKSTSRVQVGDHWPERPACLDRSDGSHVARLLALPSHMPGSPAA
ncbi:hypothetical protein ACTZWW_04340 [Salinarimonas sp. NSM]|uniref:hypothetical protein n=1 Tax=Salinarimonas sp. NSM TaxID=3458003 RepID=UPI004035C3D3